MLTPKLILETMDALVRITLEDVLSFRVLVINCCWLTTEKADRAAAVTQTSTRVIEM